MTRLIISAIFCLIINISFCQTQVEINEKAATDYKKADRELGVVYQKILKEYKDDTVFIKNLKAAERIWTEFRDAEMNAKYPDREDGYYGSIQPTCWYLYEKELTEERIKQLKIWLTGSREGDSCSGSVKIID